MSAILSNSGGARFNNDQGDIAGATRDYKQTRSDYGRAMRLLRRDSRRNPESALKMIGLRNQAREEGVELGGAPRAEDNARNARSYMANLQRIAADRGREAQLDRGLADRGRQQEGGINVLNTPMPMSEPASVIGRAKNQSRKWWETNRR